MPEIDLADLLSDEIEIARAAEKIASHLVETRYRSLGITGRAAVFA